MFDDCLLSLRELSDKTKTPYKTIRDRFDKGWTVAKIVSQPKRKADVFNYDGVDKTLCQLAKEYKKNIPTLYYRIYKLKWNIKKAMEANSKTEK